MFLRLLKELCLDMGDNFSKNPYLSSSTLLTFPCHCYHSIKLQQAQEALEMRLMLRHSEMLRDIEVFWKPFPDFEDQ